MVASENTVSRHIHKKGLIFDWLIFLALVGLPSNFFGMVDPQWFYMPGSFDFRMISIFAYAALSVLMFSKWRLLLTMPSGFWLMIIAIYVLVQFIFSSLNFGFSDAFKVFRYYCLPLVAIGPLLYLLQLPRERLLRLIKWTFIATVLQGLFYILHHAGLSVFYSPTHELIYFGASEVQRYNHAFPPYTLLILNAALLLFLLQRRAHYLFYMFILAAVIILYATRGLIISAVISVTFVAALISSKRGIKTLARTGVVSLFIIIGGITFMMLFPDYLDFIAERFLELAGPGGLRSAPNYNRRMLLVEIATYDMATLKDVLIGHGYEFRLLYDYLPGNLFTELTMQGDAPIAGLLFTEGIMGVFLRAIPFVVLLVVHIRIFVKAHTSTDIILSSLVIVTIFIMALTWLQTTALRDLPFSLLPLVLLHRLHTGISTHHNSSYNNANHENKHSDSIL